MNIRIPFEEVQATVSQALLRAGLSEEQAERVSTIHSESSLDGVASHGLNRVARFIEFIRQGLVYPQATPELLAAKGAVENYDGHLGIGILNAELCMDRAIALAKAHGIGCVSLKNTTHWMRGGTYSLQAANAGYIGICWINTESNMPMWGSDTAGVGNNPLCISIPRANGPVALDMAMSQYSYGKLETYRLADRQLPFPGGYDSDGNLTTDPAAIEQSRRILPTGYWKGSGLSLVLDLAVAALANGNSGTDLDKAGAVNCTGCSQVFLAFDPYLFGSEEEIQAMWDERIEALGDVRYPGQRALAERARGLEEGVEVDASVWEEIVELAGM